MVELSLVLLVIVIVGADQTEYLIDPQRYKEKEENPATKAEKAFLSAIIIIDIGILFYRALI